MGVACLLHVHTNPPHSLALTFPTMTHHTEPGWVLNPQPPASGIYFEGCGSLGSVAWVPEEDPWEQVSRGLLLPLLRILFLIHCDMESLC